MYTVDIKWSAEDVVNAFENHGKEITLAQAEQWLKAKERGFTESMTENGNEILYQMASWSIYQHEI